METSILESINSLKASNIDGSLSEPIRLIEKLQYELFQQIQNSITNSKENFSVMCHGDLWVNNIMFSNSSQAVRFFDLQAMRYTSPVFDILHFIYTSTKRELRDHHINDLLESYCRALFTQLKKYLNDADIEALSDTFSLQNIQSEFYEHILYGLAISMWILPAVTFDPNNIPNLDVISEMNSSAKQLKCTQKLTPEYHERMKDLALEFYQNGYLDCNNKV